MLSGLLNHAEPIPFHKIDEIFVFQGYSYSNQAFDYRLPNKLTAFYNQTNNQQLEPDKSNADQGWKLLRCSHSKECG